MNDQVQSGFRNTRLLVIAVLLGVLFVVLFNIQSCREEALRQGNQKGFVLVQADLTPGQVLTADNVKRVNIPGDVGGQLKGLREWNEIVLDQTRVTVFVAKNSLLRLADTGPAEAEEDELVRQMKMGWDTVSLPVDSQHVASGWVHRGSRVDLFGAVRMPGSPTETQLIIESLEVMGADGRVDIDSKRGFRSLDVQVPRDLAPKLLEVKRRVIGPMSVGVRRPDDTKMTYPYDPSAPQFGGTIAKPVADSLSKPFTEQPAVEKEPS
jgi:Flp pilus assembly protein CpaB